MVRASNDERSIRDWLRTWGGLVAASDMGAARDLFEPGVVGFGTRASVANGIDALVDDQWSQVWPSLGSFAFDVDGAHLWLAVDGRQAVIAATWTSSGPRVDGTTGARDGRATVVLRREDPERPWRGVHTHFSLNPG